MPPKIQQLLLRHFAKIVAHHPDAPGIRPHQAGGQLHNQRFSRAAFAEQHFGLAGPNFEGNSAQHIAFIEADPNVLESDQRFARDEWRVIRGQAPGAAGRVISKIIEAIS